MLLKPVAATRARNTPFLFRPSTCDRTSVSQCSCHLRTLRNLGLVTLTAASPASRGPHQGVTPRRAAGGEAPGSPGGRGHATDPPCDVSVWGMVAARVRLRGATFVQSYSWQWQSVTLEPNANHGSLSRHVLIRDKNMHSATCKRTSMACVRALSTALIQRMESIAWRAA